MQLDAAVEHLAEEAKREGRTPELGRPGSREAQDHLLVVLVYRAELDDGADRLGIRVSERQIEARLAHREEGDDEEKEDSFARSTARAQVVYQEIYKRVTKDVRVLPAEIDGYLRGAHASRGQRQAVRTRLLKQKRNAAMRRWIVANDRRLAPQIHYARGYAPVH